MRNRLVIIPARGGSKGIPNKNIVDVCGKPLISYTIELALELEKMDIINEVIVSTDSEEIAGISKSLGAKVPFIRPDYLSNDQAKTVDVLLHALNFYNESGMYFDYVILLQPTTPLRTASDVKKAIELYDNHTSSSLISCFEEEYICDLVSYYKVDDYAEPLNENHNKGYRRQDIQSVYVRNGAIYITDTEYLLSEKKVISDMPLMYVMSKSKSLNIDTLEDLEMARWIVSRQGS